MSVCSFCSALCWTSGSKQKNNFPPHEASSSVQRTVEIVLGKLGQERGRGWEQIWTLKGWEDRTGASRISEGGTPICKDMKYK